MNRVIISIFFLLLCLGNVRAQVVEELGVSDLQIAQNESEMTIDFTVSPKEIDVKSISQMTIIPEIISADSLQSVSLTPIVVAGRNRWLIWERTKESLRPANLLRAGKSAAMHYHASVPFEDWMEHSIISFRESVTGCNSCPQVDDLINVALIDKQTVEHPATNYADYYIQPKAEATKVRQLEGQAYIDFPVNKIEIYPDYRRNSIELAKIIATIDTVKNDPDCTVSAVSLKGYASPEGSYDNNVRLAKGRTQTLCDYVMSHYDFPKQIVTTAYEPEDWEGLRRWLENSDIKNRDGIIAIVDANLAPDPKDLKIKKTYPSEYAYLLKEVYPGLRHSDYRIEYVIRSFTDTDEIRKLVKTAPQKLSLEEFFLAANACEPGSDEFYDIFETAVRMYPMDETANMNAAVSAMARGDDKKASRYLEHAGSGSHAEQLRDIFNKKMDAKEQPETLTKIKFLL